MIHVYGTNLWLALDTQPSVKAPVIARGRFAFQGTFDSVECSFGHMLVGGGVGGEDKFLWGWKYSVIDTITDIVMIVLSCKNRKNPDNSSYSSFVQIWTIHHLFLKSISTS